MGGTAKLSIRGKTQPPEMRPRKGNPPPPGCCTPLLGEPARSEPAEMVTWSECTNQDTRRPGLEPIKRPAYAWEVRTSTETRQVTTFCRCTIAGKMEVDEEPMDPTDPVEDTLPVHNPETELKEVPAAGESVPPSSDGASYHIMVSREDGHGSSEESQKDSEQAGEAGAEEKLSLVEETLEPREMDATPAVPPPSPEAAGKETRPLC